jgi:hypothetical protein
MHILLHRTAVKEEEKKDYIHTEEQRKKGTYISVQGLRSCKNAKKIQTDKRKYKTIFFSFLYTETEQYNIKRNKNAMNIYRNTLV